MELSTTTRGKAKLLWNGYTKHTEKNDMIRWHCTCRASKLCPASAYTDLLPAYPVLKIDHNHCPEPMKLEVIFLKEICLYIIFIGFTKMPCYQNIGYQDVLLPKCLLPKCPITEMSSYRNVLLPKCQLPKYPSPKCPLPKCLDTRPPSLQSWGQLKQSEYAKNYFPACTSRHRQHMAM